jgi:hypothetical protein
LLSLFAFPYSLFTVSAHEGEDHSADKKLKRSPLLRGRKSPASPPSATYRTDAGQFNVLLTRTPSDPRTGETGQLVVRLAEKVEGGFGGGDLLRLKTRMFRQT